MAERATTSRAAGDAESFLSQSTAMVAANIASALLALLFVSRISRTLGPAGYGTVTAAISLASLLLLPVAPLSGALTRFAARFHADAARGRLATLLFTSLSRLALAGLPALLLVLAARSLLERALGLDALPGLLLLALFVLLSIAIAVPRAVLSGQHRFAGVGLNQIAEALARLLVGAGLVASGSGPAGALAGYASGLAAALALSLFQLRALRSAPREPVDARALLRFCAPVLLTYAWFTAASNLDVVVAKHVLPASDAGLYGAASGFAKLLFLAGTPIYSVLFARVSALRSAGEARRLFARAMALMALGLAASCAIPFLAGELALRLLFGAQFTGALPILQPLWLASALLVLQAAAAHYLLAADRLRAAGCYLLPAALLAGLLALHHRSAAQLAGCVLTAALASSLLTALLLWLAPPPAERAD